MRASSPSSSTTSSGSVYTSADDARRCTETESNRRSFDSEDVGTVRLLGSTRLSRDRSRPRIIERFKINKWVLSSEIKVQHCSEFFPNVHSSYCLRNLFLTLKLLASITHSIFNVMKYLRFYLKKKIANIFSLLINVKLEISISMLLTIEVPSIRNIIVLRNRNYISH